MRGDGISVVRHDWWVVLVFGTSYVSSWFDMACISVGGMLSHNYVVWCFMCVMVLHVLHGRVGV